LPGAPSDFYFTTPFDTLYLEVRQVAEPLYQALEVAIRAICQVAGIEVAEIAALHRVVKRIPETAPDEREGWYLYGEPERQGNAGSVRTALERLPKAAQALTESVLHPLYIQQFSLAVAMFGSTMPAIGQADAELLTQALLKAFAQDMGPTAHDLLV